MRQGGRGAEPLWTIPGGLYADVAALPATPATQVSTTYLLSQAAHEAPEPNVRESNSDMEGTVANGQTNSNIF